MSDAPWWVGSPDRTPPVLYPGSTRRSMYITLRDGTRLAADVNLPNGLPEGERVPALLSMTPYVRGVEFRHPLFEKLAARAGLSEVDWGARFARYGYAFVIVELRGAGASFGRKRSIFYDEVASDGAEVIDYIVAQPWSNGRVGATGISALGLTSMFLARSKHPALRAIAPRFTVFDVYHALHPGGLLERRFIEDIGGKLRAMDRNRLYDALDHPAARLIGRALIRGVRGVDDDRNGSQLAAAVAEHESNEGFDRDIGAVRFRDDPLPYSSVEATLDTQSPMAFVDDLFASGIPIYAIGGWLDGAFNRELIHLHANVRTPGSRLTLGPWEHGGRHNSSPVTRGRVPTAFDQAAELIRFFDLYLRDVDHRVSVEPPIRYFTMGEERWKESDTWPPPGTETVRLRPGPAGTLTRSVIADDGVDVYQVDQGATTGVWSRYGKHLSGGNGPARYPDRRAADARLLCYTSEPLADSMEVTGHPFVTMTLSTDATDGAVIVYLEDVAPDGTVLHVTEGCLRVTHRRPAAGDAPYIQFGAWRTGRRADSSPAIPGEVMELMFDLLPTSWLFRRGHAVRMAIAGADKDNFVVVPPDVRPTLTVHRAGTHVDLPVMPR